MDDTQPAGTINNIVSLSSAASPEASAIATAVEHAVETAQAAAAPTAAEKQAAAQAIYYAWRNKHLRGLPAQSFAQVEAASSALIAAIVAAT
jgi:hypothetical protein